MIEIGKVNTLKVVKEVDFGLYLDGGEAFGEILIPTRYVPEDTEVDHYLDVFIYLDSEDRLIATTEEPYAQVGDFAFLKCVSTTSFGAFLDWGLPKDLLVPFSEQAHDMVEGLSYFVRVYLDEETERIVASAKTNQFLDNIPHDFEEGDQVDLIIGTPTELGMKVIVNGQFSGLIYHNEIFTPVKPGMRTIGFIKKIREDEKLDIALQEEGYAKVEGVAGEILDKIKKSGGYIELNDKSSPESIKHVFGISKKVFKKAIGALYKDRIITIEPEGIRLIK
ncbi:CvfB family protein [Crocinitomix algicola]|uniref:CvfB family protein n=1 Tax=Crocinitomix algicola TaxID=1740263 RepID=UPI00082DBD0F|nr:S1-like domain-containing RNA-binding protein [Crocinitomix algicola]